jgi:hypothetical protein
MNPQSSRLFKPEIDITSLFTFGGNFVHQVCP